jgi:cytoplasmic iron level regulating protein YaaA (DUF328/UPF0246 family)
MLILLPPSEGKAPSPTRGRPLDLARLAQPALTQTRAQLASALVELCSGDPAAARAALGLSPGLAGELDVNRRLLTAPTRPAAELYTGVLYEALGLATLPPAARRRAGRWLLVFSGLWGALQLSDRVPAYRLSPDAALPGVGTLASVWREPLAAAMTEAAARGLVLDLRSTSYAALWRPTGSVADRTVTLRVLQERVPGDPASRAVVSHFNKATKGRLVRALLTSTHDPKTPHQLLRALDALGYAAEPTPGPTRKPGRPHEFDVVVTQL